MRLIPNACRSNILVLLVCIISCVGFAQDVQKASELPLQVSMVRLLANPEQFKDKEIAVTGVIRWKFEEHCLYLDPGHATIADLKSCIWLPDDIAEMTQFEKKNGIKMHNLDGKWVNVSGVFRLPGNPDVFLAIMGRLENLYGIVVMNDRRRMKEHAITKLNKQK